MVELYTEDFQQAIEQYQHSSDDPKIRALDIRGEHSWERAVKKAREAEEKYSEGGQGRWRKLGRRLTEKSAAALPVVRLIPNDSFCSVISGGLRLVVELSAHYHYSGLH